VFGMEACELGERSRSTREEHANPIRHCTISPTGNAGISYGGKLRKHNCCVASSGDHVSSICMSKRLKG